MKKIIILAVAMLFAVSSAFAMSPEEVMASAKRIEKLKAAAPAASGVQQIDDLVAKCKSIASGTVAIAGETKGISKNTDKAKLKELAEKVKKESADVGEASKMVGGATSALKALKNPMKLKSATTSLGYAEEVIKNAGEELNMQGKSIGDLLK